MKRKVKFYSLLFLLTSSPVFGQNNVVTTPEENTGEISTIAEGNIFIEPKIALIEVTIEQVKDPLKGFNDLYLSLDQAQTKLKTIKGAASVNHINDKFITSGTETSGAIKKGSPLKIIRKLRLTITELSKLGEVTDSILNTIPGIEINSIKLLKDDNPDFSTVYKSISEKLVRKLRNVAQSIGQTLDEKNLLINFSEEPNASEIREQLAENPSTSLDSGGKEIKIVGQIRGKLLKK
jgi:hypothetical protein